jgi:hypothetical protein
MKDVHFKTYFVAVIDSSPQNILWRIIYDCHQSAALTKKLLVCNCSYLHTILI